MSKRIEIVTTVASLIEPGKNYLLQVNMDSGLTKDDARQIAERIEEWGAKSITVMYSGKPIELTEVPNE